VTRPDGHPAQAERVSTLDLAHALLLAGGVAAFLAGDILFRRTLRIGLGASAVVQLSVLGIVLGGSLAAEPPVAWARGRRS
jgi:hypothetical protein